MKLSFPKQLLPLYINVPRSVQVWPFIPNPKDDDNLFVNVEEILRELYVERAKNRDLNQTISDILEEMEAMKKNIIRNQKRGEDH